MDKRSQPPPYTPPQPGLPPQPLGIYPDIGTNATPTQVHTVIVTQGPSTTLGPMSASMICPSCHSHIVTTVETEPTSKTHLFALLLCLFGCYPCCCIPYCVDSCQSQQHFCPNCKAYLGSYNV